MTEQRTPDQSYVCADCKNIFLNPPRCTTCGAEKLYDATVRSQAETIERLRQLLWRIQPILNPGSEIAYKVEREIGSVHTNRDGLKP